MRSISRRIFRLRSKRPLLCGLFALASLGDPLPASAQELRASSVREQRPAAVEPEQPTRWYGWQTAVFDGVAIGLFAGAMATFKLCLFSPCNNSTSESLAIASLFTYGAGAPLVHGGHGRWGTAAASLGLRAAPFAVGVPLMAAEEKAGAPIFLGGILAAMIVDATVLAREPVPQDSARFHLTPVVDPHRRSGFVVVAREF